MNVIISITVVLVCFLFSVFNAHYNCSGSPILPFVSNASMMKKKRVEYYPWKDGRGNETGRNTTVDYNTLCSSLMNVIESSTNNLTLLSVNTRGGLGHIHVSLFLSVSYAILLKRQLHSKVIYYSSFLVVMNPIIWNNTHSCVNSVRYDGRQCIQFS